MNYPGMRFALLLFTHESPPFQPVCKIRRNGFSIVEIKQDRRIDLFERDAGKAHGDVLGSLPAMSVLVKDAFNADARSFDSNVVGSLKVEIVLKLHADSLEVLQYWVNHNSSRSRYEFESLCRDCGASFPLF